MASQTLHPPVVWAQRKDQVFLSVDLQDVKSENIKLEPTKLSFFGKSGTKQYSFEIEFLKEIDPAKSKYVVRPRSIEFVVIKKDLGYWERILKEQPKIKLNWLKVDWNKWKDEDEVAEDDGGFDMGGMGNFDMGQFGGNEGADMNSDSDEEEIPGLEEEKEKKEGEKEKKEEEKEKKEGKVEDEKKA